MPSKHATAAVEWGDKASLEMIALDAALSAPQPNPRSPAFPIQEIFRLEEINHFCLSREDFLVSFPKLHTSLYKGNLSWNAQGSEWQLKDGPVVPCTRIQDDAVRWYIHGWDFSRHVRDSKFSYPEDKDEFGWYNDSDPLDRALMPLPGELTRRIFSERSSGALGYCDVFRSEGHGSFTVEFGFFDDPRTHRQHIHIAPFHEVERCIIPSLLRNRTVLSYAVLSLSARRGA